MKFCADFGAEDADRLTPFKDDKLKNAEITPFQAGLDNSSMADNGFYVTRGVSEKIPLPLQIIMWELIEDLPVDKDSLQVFSLSEENGRQVLKHS